MKMEIEKAERLYQEWKQRIAKAQAEGWLSKERVPFEVRIALRKLREGI
jgi:hypothetical protein